MPQVEHVQVAVSDGEACARVRTIAYARAQAYAMPFFQLYIYRHPECVGVLFFRNDDDFFETLRVGKVSLCFAETWIGKDLACSVGQMTAEETVRIVWRPLDTRSAEIIHCTRFQDKLDGGGCGGLCNADFMP